MIRLVHSDCHALLSLSVSRSFFTSSSFSPPITSSWLFPRLWRGVAEPSLSTMPIGCVAGLESEKRSAVASIIWLHSIRVSVPWLIFLFYLFFCCWHFVVCHSLKCLVTFCGRPPLSSQLKTLKFHLFLFFFCFANALEYSTSCPALSLPSSLPRIWQILNHPKKKKKRAVTAQAEKQLQRPAECQQTTWR